MKNALGYAMGVVTGISVAVAFGANATLNQGGPSFVSLIAMPGPDGDDIYALAADGTLYTHKYVTQYRILEDASVKMLEENDMKAYYEFRAQSSATELAKYHATGSWWHRVGSDYHEK